jgi:hypothetical protein
MKIHGKRALLFFLALLPVSLATGLLGAPWWAGMVVGGVFGWFWPWKVVEFT